MFCVDVIFRQLANKAPHIGYSLTGKQNIQLRASRNFLRSKCAEVLCKIGIFKKIVKFTGKRMRRSLF